MFVLIEKMPWHRPPAHPQLTHDAERDAELLDRYAVECAAYRAGRDAAARLRALQLQRKYDLARLPSFWCEVDEVVFVVWCE